MLKEKFVVQFHSMKKMQQKLTIAEKEKVELEKKLKSAHSKLREARAKVNLGASQSHVRKDVQDMVESKTKNILWSMVKFIQCDEDMYSAGKLLVKYADIDKAHVDTTEKRANFINTYKLTIRKAIFARRNYVAAEHKKVMVKHYKDTGSMPSVDALVKCLKREITSEEDYKIFEFYWEELLPKQVGSLVWSKDVRNYVTICDARRRDIQSLPMITAQDEAFTVLVIQNSMERWKREVAKGCGVDTSQEKKANHNGIFTTTDSGQNEWGGWSEAGLDVFHKYVDENEAARKKKDTHAIEKKCLDRLRKKYGIICHDHKSQVDFDRSNKQKKRRGLEVDVEKPLKKRKQAIPENLLNFDSDDEEHGQEMDSFCDEDDDYALQATSTE